MRKLFLILMTLIACSWNIMAQTQTYRGTVVDAATGDPLIGATVMPIGGGQGTATDIDGNFKLEVPSKVHSATVSYVGYKAQNVTLSNNMVVRLVSSSSDLDELMVVAYGTAKKSAYTGSASVVNAETIENSLVSTATESLNGKIAGVQLLSSNGQPGTSPAVLIRGIGSINAVNTPLYVLDGMPYDGDISGINTMDIESMTVLKDAAAAALYGARGANGVILITTKKGRSGNAKVVVDARWGSNSRAVPKYDVLNDVNTFSETMYQAMRNGYYYNTTMSAEAAHNSVNANFFNYLGYQVYTVPQGEGLFTTAGKINPNATLGYSDGTYYFTPDDWGKEQLRHGLRQEYNVSVTGGNDRFNYYVSGAFLSDEGLIKDSHFKRLSTRTVLDYQVKEWMKIGTNITYTYTNNGYPGDQDLDASTSSANAFYIADQMPCYYPMYVRTADGQIMYDTKTGKRVYDYGDGKVVPYSRTFMSSSNPAGNLAYDTEEYLTDLLNGKWYVQLTPVEGLNVTGTVGYFLDNTRYHSLGNPYYGQASDYGGSAVQYNSRTRAINLQALATYTKTFADLHDLDVLLGYESYDLNIEDLQGVGYNLYLPNSWVMNNTIDNKNPYGSVDEYATRGLFARVNYGFDSRYYFSASVRRDASSRFAPNNRWGTFWSLSGAWDMAKEKFLQNTWVDQLKFKVSFGQQGNDNLGRGYYPWQDRYQITGANGVWSDGTLYSKGNPDITWETSNNFNVGFDFSFLNSLVSGTIEFFNRQTSNMLYNKPVSPSLGYSSIPMNIGSMRNNGVELELNVRPVATKNITWDLNFNITTINNKILKLHPDLKGQTISGSQILREGCSMYQFYIVDYAGVDPATGLALYWDANPLKDDNGDVVLDKYGQPVPGEQFLSTDRTHAFNNNRKVVGNLMPKAYGGFGTSLSLYGVDLSLSFAYQFGGKVYDETYQALMHGGDAASAGRNWHKDILNAWSETNRNTNVPRLDTEDQFTNSGSTRWLVSSNYLTLQNITLGYNFPERIVKKMGLNGLRIYGAAENLFLLSARKGMDPRQGYMYTNGSTYKGMRSISGGIRFEF